jgi:hypothetical protein
VGHSDKARNVAHASPRTVPEFQVGVVNFLLCLVTDNSNEVLARQQKLRGQQILPGLADRIIWAVKDPIQIDDLARGPRKACRTATGAFLTMAFQTVWRCSAVALPNSSAPYSLFALHTVRLAILPVTACQELQSLSNFLSMIRRLSVLPRKTDKGAMYFVKKLPGMQCLTHTLSSSPALASQADLSAA